MPSYVVNSSILHLLQLGDPEKKAASNAEFHLSKLLADHPSMKVTVCLSVCGNIETKWIF